MNLLGLLKKRYDRTAEVKGVESRGRRQLNATVDERLKDTIKRRAAELGVPRYVIAEHSLEIGLFYLTMAMSDDKTGELLVRHLINDHLLDSGIDDDEAILRLGEGGDTSLILLQVRPVISAWKNFRQALLVSAKTRNTAHADQRQRELVQSVVNFALWVEKRGLDEPADGTADGDQGG